MLIFRGIGKEDHHLRILTVAVSVGLAILLAGLWYVQVVASKRFVEDQITQSFRTIRLPGVRGKILDRDGKVLAEDRPCYNASLYLEGLSRRFQDTYSIVASNQTAYLKETYNRKPKADEREQAKQQARFMVVTNAVYHLGLVLGQPLNVSEKEFRNHYLQRLALPLPVLRNLNAAQVGLLQEQTGLPPGVELDIQPTRCYPHGNLAAHVLGYLIREEPSYEDEDVAYNYCLPEYRGQVGIEGAFDDYLRGTPGTKSVMVNSVGYRQSENIWQPPEPGKNVVLTIDVQLQQAVEKALKRAPLHRGDEVLGAVVVLDVLNGDILAMASSPTYDPNIFMPSIPTEEWRVLTNQTTKPQLNRASQGGYAPGSIFKIVTGLAALEAGVLNPDQAFESQGYFKLGAHRIDDEAPAGMYDFKKAFKLSSNTYFIHYGLLTGLENLVRMGTNFHLGETTDLPTRQANAGIFPTREYRTRRASQGDPWRDGDTANLSFGQGDIVVNPLQMAVLTAAVANGGKVFWPRLVMRVEPPELEGHEGEVLHFPTRLRDELHVKPRSLEVVRRAMLADVEEEGTGKLAKMENFKLGGKTGTAEIKRGGRLVGRTTWFASFGPYENPRFAVVVMVEGGSFGGTTCAPVAKEIYQAIYARLHPAKPDTQVLMPLVAGIVPVPVGGPPPVETIANPPLPSSNTASQGEPVGRATPSSTKPAAAARTNAQTTKAAPKKAAPINRTR